MADLPEPNVPEGDWFIRDAYIKEYAQAYAAAKVAEERERCARLCEEKGPELLRWWGDGQANAACQECADAIRGTEAANRED